jgi:Response regulators consisting of a CheY-like receiver domain and a winged-helix DNA-binding domain
MNNPTLLYVEDDETLAFLTKDNLELNRYNVVHCRNGDEALQAFRQHKIDLCILDIMLPGKDGFEVAAEIRKYDHEVPILFLSAKTLKEDRIRGLKIGGDDYIVKPFSIEELILKIEIFLHRSKKANLPNTQFHLGKFLFDPRNYTLMLDGKIEVLTQRESDLLKLFSDNKNQVLTREQILKNLWGNDDYFMGRSLDVFISRLRKIISKDPSIQIENLHGIGFKFSVRDEKEG